MSVRLLVTVRVCLCPTPSSLHVSAEEVKFYLGTHIKSWLWREDTEDLAPFFVSWVRLRRRKTPYVHRARQPWAMDSGGFSEIALHGRWLSTPAQYVEAVEQYSAELGNMEWAAQQDWMCEPQMIAKTGLSVREHQERTVGNYLQLKHLAPHLPIAPVLQGWEIDDYHLAVQMFESAGVDLRSLPVVGVGSVCRRQATTEICDLFEKLSVYGLRLHGFGVKTQGIAAYGEYLSSADSMAWSSAAGYFGTIPECAGKHQSCSNCPEWARQWRRQVLSRVIG